ncbi:Bromodomain-like superfamily [Sesbania bispinosa]|nr:Bromodomain-like superfamily [Sesbania bispinosa]
MEGQRRSPRISALEASCMRHHLNNGQGPAFRTRDKKKKKSRPLQQVPTLSLASTSSNKGMKHPPHENIRKRSANDQPSKSSSSTLLPVKQILELALDTLQRRDTYEIFAEPVDPNEVEDYYAIIKEPMDFGTMRAKLHEGMYKTLEQFEHDVSLIFNNAMHFNSPGTVYFKQARVINELAKKVFDLLKINPEKFEMEFSETRRKVGRKSQGDFMDSTNMKPNEITIGGPTKNMPCSSRGTLSQKSFRTNHGCSNTTKQVNSKDVEVHTGAKYNSRYRSLEVDRRCTYRPFSLSKDDSIFSTIYDKLKQVEYVSQHDIGYKDSLMMFVKDLGPTAQNIAKKKLLGCAIRTTSTYVPLQPNTFDIVTTSTAMSQYPLNQFLDHHNEMRSSKEKINMEVANGREKVEGTLSVERDKGHSPLKCDTQGNHIWSLGCNKIFQNQSGCSNLHYSRAYARDLSCSDHGSKEADKKSGMMLLDKSKLVNQEQLPMSILENPQTNMLKSRLENNYKFQSQRLPLESNNVSCFVQDKGQMQESNSKFVLGDRENIEQQCPTNGISCSSEAMEILKSDQSVPLAPGFVFNLPYLKTRLNQINSSEQHGFLKHDSSGKDRPFHNPPTYLQTTIHRHNQQQ